MSVKDHKGKWTGNYKCSLCDTEFRKHPNNPATMTDEFNAHVRSVHPSAKMPDEDVNQAALRTVSEATDKL
ncbi:MAG TPA: hypothetical protein VIJ38_15335 [Acidobacteriaceae bacterium]